MRRVGLNRKGLPPFPALVLLILASLLVGGLSGGGAAGSPVHPAPSRIGALSPSPGTTREGPSPSSSPAAAPIGQVVKSPLLNYNTTLSGNFGTTVRDWAVGPGAFVPSTGDLWLSDNLTQTFGGPEPGSAPAIVFDPINNSFSGIVPQLANTTDLLFDPTNGWTYSTNAMNGTVGVFDPVARTWLGSVPVGIAPSALAIDPQTGILYVANSGSNNLTLINTTTGTALTTGIPTGTTPDSLAFDAAHAQLFVACAGSPILYVINTSTESVATTIPLIGDAGTVAVSEYAGTLAVAIPSVGRLTVAYTSSLAVITTIIGIGANSKGVVASPSGSEFLVADTGKDRLVSVNASAATVINASIPVGAGPTFLLPDPNSGAVYSWSGHYSNLTPVNPETGQTSTASPGLAPHPVATAFDPGTGQLFVADSLTDSVLVLGPDSFGSLAAPIALPNRPYALADDPATSTVYVGLNGSVRAIDATSDTLGSAAALLPGANAALLVDAPDQLLWDMNNGTGLVSFHLGNLTPAFSPGLPPALSISGSIAFDPSGNEVFATTSGLPGPDVGVVAASTGVVLSPGIPAGANLTALSYDPSDGQVYALGDDVSMVNATTLAVAPHPIPLAHHTAVGSSITYDSTRHFLYLTTPAAVGTVGALTVIDATTVESSYGPSGTIHVGFAPTGLLTYAPSGGNNSTASAIVLAANGNSGTLSVIATSPALITYFEPSPSSIDLGQSTEFLLAYTGGAGDSSVVFSGLPSGCQTENVRTLPCTPATSGTFDVTASITDALGGTSSETVRLSVALGLQVNATFSAITFPMVDSGVVFNASALVAGGSPGYSFEWAFGDGSSSPAAQSAHAYGTPGTYLLSLNVRDQVGGIGTAGWAVTVVPAPSLLISPSRTVVDVNRTVSFTETVSGGAGTGTYSWSFGDGGTALGPTGVHSWSRPGTYVVNSTYADELGVRTTSSVSIQVNEALTGTYAVSPPPGGTSAPGTALLFSSLPRGGTTPYAVIWNFGDGSEASGLEVNHSYARAGNYTVQLLFTDGTGATLNGTLVVAVSTEAVSSSSAPGLSFPLGLFLGILVGASVAAVIVYAAGPRKRKEEPPPKASSPYVPPEPAEWKED